MAALCGAPRFENAHADTLLNPAVVVEVLSESNEAYDRGEKFAHYRRLESLAEYVFVAQNKVRVEVYVRQGKHWVLTELSSPDDALVLPSIDCRVALREIYQRVDFSNPEE